MITITNKYIVGIARYFLHKKIRKFSFSYEKEVYETDVVEQTYVRQYIAELQEAVDAEIAHLTEEYHL